MVRKGWFRIDGVQNGDRSLEDQLRGLEHIQFAGKAVLDLGCAEGLIARHALEQGAAVVHGVDIIPAHLEQARRQCEPWGALAEFCVMDLDHHWLSWWLDRYDVVLMLAVLHKLREPLALLHDMWLCLAVDLYVVRLPAVGDGVIVDARSGSVPCDVPEHFAKNGYDLERVTRGHFNEWCGYFRRRR